MIFASTLVASGATPPNPGPADFNLPAILPWGEVDGLTKPMLLVILSLVIAFAFSYAASRKAAVVPGRLQFAGEYVYGFVRNTIGRDTIGSHDFMRFVPFLFSIFLFVIINNFYGIIPFVQFPSMSHIGFPLGLALVTWLTICPRDGLRTEQSSRCSAIRRACTSSTRSSRVSSQNAAVSRGSMRANPHTDGSSESIARIRSSAAGSCWAR